VRTSDPKRPLFDTVVGISGLLGTALTIILGWDSLVHKFSVFSETHPVLSGLLVAVVIFALVRLLGPLDREISCWTVLLAPFIALFLMIVLAALFPG
jgi:hypothetical protein